MDLTPSIDSELVRQGLDSLTIRLQLHPEDSRLLEQAAIYSRMLGDLAQAKHWLQQVTPVNLSPAAQEMLRILCGENPGSELDPAETWPSPFLMIEDFLPARDVQLLLQLVQQNREQFKPSTFFRQQDDLYDSSYDSTYRQSSTWHTAELDAVFNTRVQDLFPELQQMLRVPAFDLQRIGKKLLIYEQGDFFAAHHDASHQRQISFGYFLFPGEKAFTQGDFILYDTNRHDGSYLPRQYTRFTCRHNSIVFFPSACWHEVTPLCANQPGASRFAVIGHLASA